MSAAATFQLTIGQEFCPWSVLGFRTRTIIQKALYQSQAPPDCHMLTGLWLRVSEKTDECFISQESAASMLNSSPSEQSTTRPWTADRVQRAARWLRENHFYDPLRRGRKAGGYGVRTSLKRFLWNPAIDHVARQYPELAGLFFVPEGPACETACETACENPLFSEAKPLETEAVNTIEASPYIESKKLVETTTSFNNSVNCTLKVCTDPGATPEGPKAAEAETPKVEDPRVDALRCEIARTVEACTTLPNNPEARPSGISPLIAEEMLQAGPAIDVVNWLQCLRDRYRNSGKNSARYFLKAIWDKLRGTPPPSLANDANGKISSKLKTGNTCNTGNTSKQYHATTASPPVLSAEEKRELDAANKRAFEKFCAEALIPANLCSGLPKIPSPPAQLSYEATDEIIRREIGVDPAVFLDWVLTLEKKPARWPPTKSELAKLVDRWRKERAS